MIKILNYIRGVITITLITLNLLVHGTLTLIFGIPAWIIPRSMRIHKYALHFVHLVPMSWGVFNGWILSISLAGKLTINRRCELSRKKWYVLISNHQSWLDILLLNAVFAVKTPPLKFFMKKELLWTLPIAGLCCYLLDFPFMARHTRADIRKNPALKGKDIETAKEACQKFINIPTTVINFMEGTRFTTEKHDRQSSPYQNLLKPKAGGTAVVINEMHDCLAGILNVTINYDTKDKSMFNIFCGNFKQVTIDYELLPVTPELLGNYYEDRKFRSQFQQWLNKAWEQKDQQLTELTTHDD